MELPPPYVAPDPTPAEIANAKLKHYDPYDRLGQVFLWDLAADDILAAAGTVHDACYTRGGTKEQFDEYDSLFVRNSLVLAKGLSANSVIHTLEVSRVYLFFEVITVYRTLYKTTFPVADRNNDETRITGWINQFNAQSYINAVALATGQPIPTEVPGMPV